MAEVIKSIVLSDGLNVTVRESYVILCQCVYSLLLLSRFSRVRLCATPQTAAHQAPPSLGFSRQEHWSGLPFPSPCVFSVMSNSALPRTVAHQSPLYTSRQENWNGLPFPPPGDLPYPGIEPKSPASPALAGRFFTTETGYYRGGATLLHLGP